MARRAVDNRLVHVRILGVITSGVQTAETVKH